MKIRKLSTYSEVSPAEDTNRSKEKGWPLTLSTIQLVLTHLRKSKVFPHEVTDEEICQLLLRSISGRLVTEHVVSVRVINYLREQCLVAKVNVGDTIPHLCMAWRRSLYDVLCFHSFMEIRTLVPE